MSDLLQFTESGLDYIWLANGFEITHDETYGELLAVEQLESLLCIITKDILAFGELSGAEIQYLRKHYSLSQESLATHLGLPQSVVALAEVNDTTSEEAEQYLKFFKNITSGTLPIYDHPKPERLIYSLEKNWQLI